MVRLAEIRWTLYLNISEPKPALLAKESGSGLWQVLKTTFHIFACLDSALFRRYCRSCSYPHQKVPLLFKTVFLFTFGEAGAPGPGSYLASYLHGRVSM